RISAEPSRLVRLYLSPEHRRAADLVSRWMRGAGLDVYEDEVATVRGRRHRRAAKVEEPRRRLLIGSHIDTVIDAGKYDGPLGVVAGILALDYLSQHRRELPYDVDILAFGDEEGSRFPSALSTSAALVGVFEPTILDLADRDGITFAQALRSYGKD